MNTEQRERAEAKAEEVLAKYTTEKFGNTDVDPVIFFGSLHKQIISAMIDFHKQELQRIGEVVYVPVSVEDELPPLDIKVIVIGEQKGMNPQMGGAYPFITHRSDLSKTLLAKEAERHQDKNLFMRSSYVTHWLKKLSLLEVKDLDVSDNATMKPNCDAPLTVQNNIDQSKNQSLQ